MDRTIARNAAFSVVLCAGLGLGGFAAISNAADATEGETTAAASAENDGVAAASSVADKASSSAASDSAAAGAYADGTYEGTGKGMGGDVPVTVTVEGGVITAVEVGDNSETQGIGSKAVEQLPAEIVAANGTEGVDGVSGASVTSKAIFTAVEEALEAAQA